MVLLFVLGAGLLFIGAASTVGTRQRRSLGRSLGTGGLAGRGLGNRGFGSLCGSQRQAFFLVRSLRRGRGRRSYLLFFSGQLYWRGCQWPLRRSLAPSGRWLRGPIHCAALGGRLRAVFTTAVRLILPATGKTSSTVSAAVGPAPTPPGVFFLLVDSLPNGGARHRPTFLCDAVEDKVAHASRSWVFFEALIRRCPAHLLGEFLGISHESKRHQQH